MSVPAGTFFGRFEVERLLGKGGMGEVYLAHDAQLQRSVAIKVLPQRFAGSAEQQRRFRQEARAASALNHPNILTVYDIGLMNQTPFIATEYVDGLTLRQRMRSRPMSLHELFDITLQLASALAAAHRAGLVHRDIKPENVMLRTDGFVKLLDFGLAKLNEPRRAEPDAPTRAETHDTMIVGTIRYMSPEAVRAHPVDLRTDIWSLGILLFEMICGRVPFRGESDSDLIVAILTEPVPPLEAKGGGALPVELAPIIERTLEKNRERRFPNMEALIDDLRVLHRSLGYSHSTESLPPATSSAQRVWSGPWGELVDGAGASPRMAGRRGSLPTSLTSFIGRESEVESIRSLLMRPDVRLLTLTGPGGPGKTRLALQVGAEVSSEFPDGVLFVPLAAVGDADRVASAIAEVLGLKDAGGATPIAALQEDLADRRLLLVVDNLEQVIQAAPILNELLGSCSRLKILATSRERLRLTGERDVPVPPLRLPVLESLPDLDTLREISSVALFVQRAIAAQPDFALTSENARAVAEICARLDGLPLAIELAAARIRLLSPEAMLTRLSSRLKLLTGGASDLAPRQRTIRGAIDWGYQLLTEDEKSLFRRLSVFQGGFTLEAAEHVAGDQLEVDVLDGLSSLLDKSFLKQAGAGGEPRFTILETLREFGLERLLESGEGEALRARHATFFLTLAERAEPELTGEGQPAWLQRIETEHDNLREALSFLIARGESESALRLTGALWWFWYVRGYYSEGRRWLMRSLDGGADLPSLFRAKALVGAGALALLQCEYKRAAELLESARETARAVNDSTSLAFSLQFSGSVAREQGELPRAVALHEESLARWRAAGEPRGIARSLNYIGFASWLQGNLDEAKRLCDEALGLFRALGDSEGIAWSLLNLGAVAFYRNDTTAAAALCKESLMLSGEVRYKEGIAWSLEILGNVARRDEQLVRARTMLRRSLELHRELGDKWRISSVLEGLGAMSAREERPEAACRLLGAADALREAIGAPVPRVEREDRDRVLAGLHIVLAMGEFDAAWSAGRALGWERAVAEALV